MPKFKPIILYEDCAPRRSECVNKNETSGNEV
jgi:hypothetical protein